MNNLLLTPEEIKPLASGYTQQSKQLEELKRQGFWRARRSRMTGEVILERAHYEAVCAGLDAMQAIARKKGAPEKRVRD